MSRFLATISAIAILATGILNAQKAVPAPTKLEGIYPYKETAADFEKYQRGMGVRYELIKKLDERLKEGDSNKVYRTLQDYNDVKFKLGLLKAGLSDYSRMLKPKIAAAYRDNSLSEEDYDKGMKLLKDIEAATRKLYSDGLTKSEADIIAQAEQKSKEAQ